MTKPYPWQPGTYTAGTGRNPVLDKLQDLAKRRWGFTNLGTFNNRAMNGHPEILSVHAVPAAADQGYKTGNKGRQAALEACRWYVQYAEQLDIVAIHDYMSNPPRAWRCDRNTWQTFPNNELGHGGHWLHVELGKRALAMTAAQWEKIWRGLPRP